MPHRGLTTDARATGHHWWPVAAVMATVAWGGNQFTPLLVMYRAGGLDPVAVDALLGAYVLGIAPALLLGGPLSDRHGRRPLLLPAAPTAALGSLVLALAADNPWLLGTGRVLSGIALGLVMAVGTTWVTELTTHDGARRASLALTGGFLLGAGAAAALAQWGPWPARLPYLLHAALATAAAVVVLRVPETAAHRAARPARPGDGLGFLPAVTHRRFLRVVLPTAPWVFGTAGAAYAVLPALLADHAGTTPIAFAGLMTVLTLGCGIGTQAVARRIDTRHSARASVVAMTLVVTGIGLGALAATQTSLAAGLLAAAVLGAGYGLTLVAGLNEITRIAAPAQLAGLTAVYYSVAYLGFFVPMALAWLARTWTYGQMFTGGAILAALCLTIVAAASQAHLPRDEHRGPVEPAARADQDREPHPTAEPVRTGAALVGAGAGLR